MAFPVERLKASILEDRSKQNMLYWADQFITYGAIPGEALLLLKADDPLPFRFSWILEHIARQKPAIVQPVVKYLFEVRDDIVFKGYKRNLAKILSLCGVPKDIEGEVADTLFRWVNDSNVDVAVKVHSIQTLFDMTSIYPELKHELISCIEDQMDKNSIAFRIRGRKILKHLLV